MTREPEFPDNPDSLREPTDLFRPERVIAVLRARCFLDTLAKIKEFTGVHSQTLAEGQQLSEASQELTESNMASDEKHFQVESDPFRVEGVNGKLELLTLSNITSEGFTVGVWYYAPPDTEDVEVYEEIRYILLLPEMPVLVLTRSAYDRIRTDGFDQHTLEGATYCQDMLRSNQPGVKAGTSSDIAELYAAITSLRLSPDDSRQG